MLFSVGAIEPDEAEITSTLWKYAKKPINDPWTAEEINELEQLLLVLKARNIKSDNGMIKTIMDLIAIHSKTITDLSKYSNNDSPDLTQNQSDRNQTEKMPMAEKQTIEVIIKMATKELNSSLSGPEMTIFSKLMPNRQDRGRHLFGKVYDKIIQIRKYKIKISEGKAFNDKMFLRHLIRLKLLIEELKQMLIS